MTKKLTVKQQTFADHYLLKGNATSSYRIAYNTENMDTPTVHSCAWELLQHKGVKKYIEEKRARSEIDIKYLTDQLLLLYEACMGEKRFDTARKSLMDIARLEGLLEKRYTIETHLNHISLMQELNARNRIQKIASVEDTELFIDAGTWSEKTQ